MINLLILKIENHNIVTNFMAITHIRVIQH